MRRSLNLPLLVEIDALYFKRDKCAKKQQTNKQAKQQQQQQQKHSGLSVADPDLQMGGGGGHPDPEIRGGGAVSKKFFFALRASIRGESKRGKSSFSFE